MGLVSVYDAYQEFLALTVCDMLRENGILVILQKEEIAGYNFNLISSGGIWGKVMVDERDANKALELVGAFKGTLGELAEAETPDEPD